MTLLITISVMSCVLLVMGVAILRLHKFQQLQSEKIHNLQSQLAALCAGASCTDDRISNFEQTLSKLREQQNTIGLKGNKQNGYEHAIRLAKKGANIDQLIDNCNLSDEEAHIISSLHGLHTEQAIH